MRKMITVYKKDLRIYFSTLSGYIFIAAVLLAGGVYVYMNNFYYGYASFGESINYVPFFFIFLAPVLAAGVFTDERRQKTDQLLYTLPLTSAQVVLGKYLALITVLAVPLAVLGLYPIVMSFYGKVNFAQAYTNLLAVFLLGMALFAICMFISSLTDNIIVSAVLCLAVTFLLYQMNGFARAFSPSAARSYLGLVLLAALYGVFVWYLTRNIYIAAIPSAAGIVVLTLVRRFSQTLLAGKINLMMNGAALFKPLENFKAGIVDVYALICYVSVTVLFVLFTMFAFERRRWR